MAAAAATICARARHVEFDQREVRRIMTHKSALLRTLVAASGGKTAQPQVGPRAAIG